MERTRATLGICKPRRPCLPLGLAAHVHHPVQFGVNSSLAVNQVDAEGPVQLLLHCKSAANFSQVAFGDDELCVESAFTGFAEANGAGFVPDDVVFAQILDENEHEDGIGAGKHAATENGADIVARPQSERQSYSHFPQVRCDICDFAAAAPEAGETVENEAGNPTLERLAPGRFPEGTEAPLLCARQEAGHKQTQKTEGGQRRQS